MMNSPYVIFAQADAGTVLEPAVPVAEGTTLEPAPAIPDPPVVQQQPSNFMMMIPIIIVFAVMIAVSMRTSSKERKKREQTINSIRKGTQIMTTGGVFCEVAEVQKDRFLVKIANNVQISIAKTAVGQVIQPAAETEEEKDKTGVIKK